MARASVRIRGRLGGDGERLLTSTGSHALCDGHSRPDNCCSRASLGPIGEQQQFIRRSLPHPDSGHTLALIQTDLFDGYQVGQGRSRLGRHAFYRAAR